MASPDGIVPAELLRAEKKREVIEWLRRAPLPAKQKAALLRGFGVMVGVPINAAEFREVEASGVDR